MRLQLMSAALVSCPLDQFIFEKGAESLTLYQWNTAIAKHCFCKICGIYTDHIRRSDPSVYGVNIGCFDDINISGYLATDINGRANIRPVGDNGRRSFYLLIILTLTFC